MFVCEPRYCAAAGGVGSSGPKFTSRTELEAFSEREGEGVSLFCQAQASPPPAFR